MTQTAALPRPAEGSAGRGGGGRRPRPARRARTRRPLPVQRHRRIALALASLTLASSHHSPNTRVASSVTRISGWFNQDGRGGGFSPIDNVTFASVAMGRFGVPTLGEHHLVSPGALVECPDLGCGGMEILGGYGAQDTEPLEHRRGGAEKADEPVQPAQ